jgi:hypothetical protein
MPFWVQMDFSFSPFTMIGGNAVAAVVVEDGLLCSPAVVVESLEFKSMAWVRSFGAGVGYLLCLAMRSGRLAFIFGFERCVIMSK